MVIDFHTHLGRIVREDTAITMKDLLKNMEKWGIDKSVILPLDATPEGSISFFTTEQVLEIFKEYPDKIIPFCKLDPRQYTNSKDTDFLWILKEYKALGCRGVGELTANLYIDDPLCKNLFRQCGQLDMPVLFHLVDRIGAHYGLVDDLYLPRLENVLKELPKTILVGHAMAFWAEIDGNVNVNTGGSYPKGKIEKAGRVCELLLKYPNLYADLSAGSGFNAITRDIEFGIKFLIEFQNKLLFGTDICMHNQEAPIVHYIKKLSVQKKISKKVYDKIMYRNAMKILELNGGKLC